MFENTFKGTILQTVQSSANINIDQNNHWLIQLFVDTNFTQSLASIDFGKVGQYHHWTTQKSDNTDFGLDSADGKNNCSIEFGESSDNNNIIFSL